MKLDRNLNANGRGKYALLKLRKLDDFVDPFQKVAAPIAAAIETLEKAGILDWGNKGESEFMVIRIKDMYADGVLDQYADNAHADGQEEYGAEIREMARRSGTRSPWCKRPD